ncbi:MAG: hypothetical protein MJ153_05950, partial [Clostridia bacterium]|nr:hypothetical protein [Clostridia bacterium]
MKKARKTAALALSLSFIMGVSGCSGIPFLGNKANDAVKEAITSYMDNITKAKIDKAAKSIAESDDDDEDELLFAARYDSISDSNVIDVIDAFLSTTEYEITDVEADEKKEEGSAKLKISVADLDAVAEDLDEDADIDDLIDAISECEDKVDDKIKLSLILDDDEWLIESGSDVDVADFYFNALEDTELSIGGSDFTESAIIAYVNDIFIDLRNGDFEKYMDEGASIGDMFDFTDADSEEVKDLVINFFKSYFANETHEVIVNSIDEEGKTANVTVKTEVPCANDLIAGLVHNHDVMVVVMANQLFNPDFDFDDLSGDMQILMFNGLVDAIPGAGTEQLTADCTVTVDENGEFKMGDGFSDCLFGEADESNVQYTDEEQQAIIMDALKYALDNGMISQEEYDSYVEIFSGNGGNGGNAGNGGDAG